jgi:trigger factor
VKNLLEPKAELVNLEAGQKVKKGHSVILDFEGKLDGQPVADASAKNFLLEVGEQNSVEDFQNGLIGMKAGESKQIDVNYPADYKNPEVAGKKVVYDVTLHEVKQKNYPELTDEVAKELQAENAADLRAKIRKSLEDELVAEQKQQSQEEVLLAFLEANPAEVPPSLVQRQLQAILADVADLLRKQRFSDNLIQDYVRKHSEDFKQRAEREVKLALLLPKVVEAEKVTATDEDFKNYFSDIMRQSGQKLDAIEKFYNDNKNRKEELANEIQRRKAMQLMLDSAKAK